LLVGGNGEQRKRSAVDGPRCAMWRDSGLSQRAFGLQQCYSQRRLSYWVLRLAAQVEAPVLLPVAIKRVASVAPALSLRSPNGWTVMLPPDLPTNWVAELLLVMQLQAESIWLATQPVDMRIGVDGLSLHVQQALGRAPCDGRAYVFSNRRHTRLKLVCWDGNGVWLCQRRQHRGQFTRTQAGDAAWDPAALASAPCVPLCNPRPIP
jgi:transposase